MGRDVESMIRDLVEIAIDMVREERLEEVAERAEEHAEEQLLDLLLPRRIRRPALAQALRYRAEEAIPRAPARNCASSSAKASWTKGG